MTIKTPGMQRLEQADPQGRDIREIVRDAYARTGSVKDAGAMLGITGAAFGYWVRQLGGEIRSEVSFPADDPEPAEAAA